MREIRTSGSMSGDGKRSVAERPKLPRAHPRLYHFNRQRGRGMAVGLAGTGGWPRLSHRRNVSQPAQSAVLGCRPFDELRRAGYVEGQNLIVDWRPYSSHVELIPAFAAELAQSKPDVIVAVGDAAIRAAQNVTKTIPILGSTDDMVASGLIRGLKAIRQGPAFLPQSLTASGRNSFSK